MNDFYIQQDWLEGCRRSTLYYPAAGDDCTELLDLFHDHVDTYWFCDINYRSGLDLPSVSASKLNLRRTDRKIWGNPTASITIRRADNGRCYRYLEPSKLVETYERLDGRRLTVIRRRGFGQIGLSKEFGERSLAVFVHRGDSPGESGSNVYFLANKKTDYEPCGNLFDKLARRLQDKAIIISDGSNSHIRHVRCFHNSEKQGDESFSSYEGRQFSFGGFSWSCVGWLSRRYGPTLVWGLTRQI